MSITESSSGHGLKSPVDSVALNDLPEGRMTHFRWVILALIFLGTTINYIDRLVIGLLASDLQKTYSISDAQYGYIGAAFGLAYALGQLISGGLLDKVGTRMGYAMALVGWSICAMLTALGRGALSFGIFRALLGFSESPAFPAAAKVCAEWFPRRQRAFAFGFVNAGSNMAAILAPLVVPWLTINYGWQSAFVVTGALGFVLLAVWLPLYRRPAEHPRVSPAELAIINSDPPEAVGATVPRTLGGKPFLLVGRLDRATFLGCILCLTLLGIGVGPLVRLVYTSTRGTSVELAGTVAVLLAILAFAWLAICVQVKRWHDLGRSGWMTLINLIPIVGTLGSVIYLGSAKSNSSTNPHGSPATPGLVGYREAWVFSLGKFLTDAMWWFHMTWLPKYLHDKYGLDLMHIGLPLVMIYLMADVGSVGGGMLSSTLIRRGYSVNASRKIALLASALCALPIMFAQRADNVWIAVIILGMATAAHQGFSSNIYTLCSDLFPKRAVASIAGLGGTFGWIGASLFQAFTGNWVEKYKTYTGPFVCASLAYLFAFIVMHALSPRLKPANIDETPTTP